MPTDAVLEVVLNQDEETVYRVAEHLIRRIPFADGDQILPVGREPLRPAESRTDGHESSSWTRSRWGLLRG